MLIKHLLVIACTTALLCGCASVESKMQTASDLNSAGKTTAAYEQYEAVFEKDPQNADALAAMADIDLAQDRTMAAKQKFEKVLEITPGHVVALKGLEQIRQIGIKNLESAWATYEKGDLSNARSQFTTLLNDPSKFLPQDLAWRVHLGIGYTFYDERQNKKSLPYFKKAAALNPNAETFKAMGLAHFKDKNYTLALETLTKSLDLTPKQYDLYAVAGLSFLKINREKIAHDLLILAIENAPEKVPVEEFLTFLKEWPQLNWLTAELGWTLYKKQMFKESLAFFETAIDKKITRPNILRGAGFAAYEMKHYEKAIEYCGMSLKKYTDLPPVSRTKDAGSGTGNPMYTDARVISALAHYHTGALEQSEALFEKSLELHPDWPVALNGMGWLKCRENEYEDAKRLFEQAVELTPDFADAKDGLNFSAAALERQMQRSETKSQQPAAPDPAQTKPEPQEPASEKPAQETSAPKAAG